MVGGAWAGPVSLRKPTTFGISFGLTTITLAWVSIQHARGTPAHFNDTTPLDERLFIAGAVMVAIAIGVIAAMTLAAFVRTTAPAPMAVAIRWGRLLSLSGRSQRGQTQLVALAVVGYAGLFAVALGRTSSGLACSFAPLMCAQNRSPRLPSLGATSVSQMIVSTAST